MNNLTIQINNLEALERLIGGDSQVEMEIRNSVVQKFAEKHLKPLANENIIGGMLNKVRAEIIKQAEEKCNKEIATFKTSYGNSITDVKLSPQIQEEIDKKVRATVEEIVRKQVDASLKFWATETILERRIKERFDYYTKEMINNEIKARIEKLKASL